MSPFLAQFVVHAGVVSGNTAQAFAACTCFARKKRGEGRKVLAKERDCDSEGGGGGGGGREREGGGGSRSEQQAFQKLCTDTV